MVALLPGDLFLKYKKGTENYEAGLKKSLLINKKRINAHGQF
jgi:hypothetical protein